MSAESGRPLPPPIRLSRRQQWRMVSRPYAFMGAVRARVGPVAHLRAIGGPMVFALTADGARDVLSADVRAYDAFWKEGFTGVAGPGSLWVLDGDAHRRERQLLAVPFQARSFGPSAGIVRDITRAHLDRWVPGATIRSIDTTRAISLDVILRVAFGVTGGELGDEARRVLTDLWHTMHPLIVFFPGLQRPWFPLWRRYARAKHAFAAWAGRYLAHRRAEATERSDALGRMLGARRDDGSPMTDEDIRDELITVLLAGHETTATALAWALYELGRHPDVADRLRQELAAIPGDDPALLVRLPLLSAVCNETLRLHTLLPEIARQCIAPVSCLGYTIPAGHAVGVSVAAIHRDTDIYPEPERFLPQRFLDRTYSPFEFLPFGGGHRRCLGAALSDFEMRLVLAEIVSAWDFVPAAVEHDVRHDIAMGTRKGVPLRLTARRPWRAPRADTLRSAVAGGCPVHEGAESSSADHSRN